MSTMFRKHDGARDRSATNCKNNLPLAVGGTYDFVLIGKTEEEGSKTSPRQ